eukprot:CAMPEP_0117529308 /NCGR_PEP_ID=MMETSP0784-20121206/37766_1 /TAXON_ID=39447 /ORGANISM="" /LENGTH=300 /DNA_ID=CAMNT_0005325627 /DNA_START=82 /DNA_END=984 /DNA_ORIENTATION=+
MAPPLGACSAQVFRSFRRPVPQPSPTRGEGRGTRQSRQTLGRCVNIAAVLVAFAATVVAGAAAATFAWARPNVTSPAYSEMPVVVAPPAVGPAARPRLVGTVDAQATAANLENHKLNAFWWERLAAATVACALVVLPILAAMPQPATALPKYDAGNWSAAVDLERPTIDQAELERRRTSPSDAVKDEAWFARGRYQFRVACAGCHTQDPKRPEKGLITARVLKDKNLLDPERMAFVIRYGTKGMPGYAADCSDLGQTGQCNIAVPFSEEDLQFVEDFVINRAADGWTELPEPVVPRRKSA